MSLAEAIVKLTAIAKQAPKADFAFIVQENDYAWQVKDILFEPDKYRAIVIITDQE